MCKRRMIISLWILLVFVENMAVADTAPVILARLNNIDARDIISKLSSNLHDVDKIVAERETSFDPDEVISGEKAREDVYTIGNVTLTVSEPYGDVYISWPAKTYDDYLTVEEEQTQKYDIDRDGYLDDGQTRMCEKTFVPEDDVQPEIKEACDSTARFVASLFGVEVVDHYVTSFALKSCFPDGQQYLTGTFKYGIIRNGLPVDTAGIWSEVSRAGFFVRGESITIQWIETEVLSAHVELYQIESEDFLSETFISSEMAEGKVHQEIEKLSSAFNSEPYVDLCYMAVPDRRGLLYATLVPAWRFRFTGEYLEESNCHRVNAYTGEVIR